MGGASTPGGGGTGHLAQSPEMEDSSRVGGLGTLHWAPSQQETGPRGVAEPQAGAGPSAGPTTKVQNVSEAGAPGPGLLPPHPCGQELPPNPRHELPAPHPHQGGRSLGASQGQVGSWEERISEEGVGSLLLPPGPLSRRGSVGSRGVSAHSCDLRALGRTWPGEVPTRVSQGDQHWLWEDSGPAGPPSSTCAPGGHPGHGGGLPQGPPGQGWS